jgi:DHA2 family multidrug resistance protein
MATHLNLGIDFRTAALMRVMQTSGLSFIFLPSNTLAYVGIPREQNNQVSGMNAFVRNIGGSIGIALLTTMLTRFSQQNQSALVAHAYQGNPSFDNLLGGVTQSLRGAGLDAASATQQAYARVMGLVQGQAVQVITRMALVVACLIPLPLIMRRPRTRKPAGDVAMLEWPPGGAPRRSSAASLTAQVTSCRRRRASAGPPRLIPCGRNLRRPVPEAP